MARTPFHVVKEWLLEALAQKGGRSGLHELIEYLGTVKTGALLPDDHLPQKGHPKDTQFKYYCRWAITALRDEGKIKRGSPRGTVELESSGLASAGVTEIEAKSEKTDRSHKEGMDQVLQGPDGVSMMNEEGEKPENAPHNSDLGHQPWLRQELTRLLPQKQCDEVPAIERSRLLEAKEEASTRTDEYRLEPQSEQYSLNKRLAQQIDFDLDHGLSHNQILAKAEVWISAKGARASAKHHLQSRIYRHLRGKPESSRLSIRQNSRETTRARSTVQQSESMAVELAPIERHRILLAHLSRFGELTPREQERLGIAPQDVSAWLDALLHVRPHALVVTPLFLWGVEGDPDPVRFTTRLAVRMTGEYLDRAAKEPIEGIEAYVWEHFGFWHLAQPHPGESKWHGYLTVPVAEPADLAASEKLDLFAHLPPLIISELVRDTSFLNEQQTWSAQASLKGSLGPLSRQMNLGIRRPLLLSDFDLSLDADRSVTLGDLPESEVLTRAYVVAGLPLCTGDEWQQSLQLSGDELSERILAHPLYAAIVQFEVHRITAKLSGELAASVHRDHDNGFSLEIDGGNSMPLWLACRTLLEDLGFWPAAHSTKDATWESAVSHALGNLNTLGVLEELGNEVHLTSQFASKIKAHPSHCQNRGEKSYRVRLAQYLEKLSRGAS